MFRRVELAMGRTSNSFHEASREVGCVEKNKEEIWAEITTTVERRDTDPNNLRISSHSAVFFFKVPIK